MNVSLYSLAIAIVLCIVSVVDSNNRPKRQVSGYRFPGPRSEDRSQYDESSDQYPRSSAAQTYRPTAVPSPYSGQTYGAPTQAQNQYRNQPSTEYVDQSGEYREPAPARERTQSQYRATQKYPKESYGTSGSRSSQATRDKEREDREAEEKKPTRLELLLAESKFTCGAKRDGYYADDSVNCQVFHYCVAGAKHSWQCPEGTVFHQVHLNCVPSSQDICSQSEKFFVVNDYLHKELEARGPNNTIRYAQRYYPEEFLGLGDMYIGPSQPKQAEPQREAPRQRGAAPVYNRNQDYADDDRQGYGSSGAAQAPASYPRYQQNYPQTRPQATPVYHTAPAAKPAPAPQSYSSPSYSAQPAERQKRPVAYANYPTAASSAAKPVPTVSYAPASGGYQQSQPETNNYYSSQQYPTPAANYAPSYKKPVAAPTAKPASASYPSYSGYQPSQYGSASSGSPSKLKHASQAGPYGSPAQGGLYDFSSLKSGVTYEEDY